MKTRKCYWMAVALAAGLAASVWGQAPVVGPAPPPPGAPLPPGIPPPGLATAAGATPPATPPGGGNIWSKLCMTPEQMLACKLWFCNSAIGKLTNGIMRPVSVFSGGLIMDRCAAAQIAADLAK